MDQPRSIELARPVAIPLGTGQIVALVDAQDAPGLLAYTWRLVLRKEPNSVRRYAVRCEGKVLMHRQITEASPAEQVDHWDADGLNNQRENLRKCGNAQNQWNRRKRSGSSRFKGVYFHGEIQKWVAQIKRLDRGHQYLGAFVSEELAAKTYDEAAREQFGAYAALNFPLPGEQSCLEGTHA